MKKYSTTVVTLAILHVSTTCLFGVENRVLMIGIDGAGGSYTQTASTPNIDALAALGSVRYDFYNEGGLIASPPEAYGASGVNWTTMNTGASAASHGVSDNGFGGNNLENVPHWFKFIKDHDPNLYTASIVNWEPINDSILPDQYADLEIGYSGLPLATEDALVKDDVVNLLNTGDPDAIFVHFDQVDGAGHSTGWGSTTYYNAISTVDGLIGEIMTALNNRPGVLSGDEDWLVLVSADHGGALGSFGHVASQGPINWEVPMVVSGPSVPNGSSMSQGTLRDMATTALWHLGIDPFGTTAEGDVIGLTDYVLGPANGIVGDLNQDGVVSGDGTGPANTDDVTAFVNGWMTSGYTTVADAYGSGDLNLDRITDLADWIILHQQNPAMAVAAWEAINAVPEPSVVMLTMMAAIGQLTLRRNHR